MNKYTFVLSDESVNSYGQIILTKGIDIRRFSKNPVMLYMHERNTVIGRWDNIRKEEGKLLADAIFDENIDLSKLVKKQVDSGILRAVSIGVSNVKTEVIKSIETIVKCELHEVSIVDIPSNENAIKLMEKNKMLKLVHYSGYLNKKKEKDILSRIISALELGEDSTEEDILSAIQDLKNGINEQETDNINNALELNIISNAEVESIKNSSHSFKSEYNNFCKSLILLDKNRVDEQIRGYLKEKKIKPSEENMYIEIGHRIGSVKLAKLIDSRSESGRLSLALQEFLSPDKKIESHKNLEWYRKNNPEYLKNNPEKYQELLNESIINDSTNKTQPYSYNKIFK